MTKTILRAVALILGVAATACGSDHMAGSSPGVFASLANAVSAAAQRHGERMAGTSASSCPAEMSRYDAEVRPQLDRMRAMSGDMDQCMSALGHTELADMQGICLQMAAEYEQHRANGCAMADIGAEASRHVEAMRQMAAHEVERAGSMETMMGGSANMMSGRCGH